MKATTAGKLENLFRDLSSKINNFLSAFFQVLLMKNDEGSARFYRRGFFRTEKSTRHSSIIERGIIRAVILKRPAKERCKKAFGFGKIARWHLDVIDRVDERFVHEQLRSTITIPLPPRRDKRSSTKLQPPTSKLQRNTNHPSSKMS